MCINFLVHVRGSKNNEKDIHTYTMQKGLHTDIDYAKRMEFRAYQKRRSSSMT